MTAKRLQTDDNAPDTHKYLSLSGSWRFFERQVSLLLRVQAGQAALRAQALARAAGVRTLPAEESRACRRACGLRLRGGRQKGGAERRAECENQGAAPRRRGWVFPPNGREPCARAIPLLLLRIPRSKFLTRHIRHRIVAAVASPDGREPCAARPATRPTTGGTDAAHCTRLG